MGGYLIVDSHSSSWQIIFSNTTVKLFAVVIPVVLLLGSLVFVADDSNGSSPNDYPSVSIGIGQDNIPEHVSWDEDKNWLKLDGATLSSVEVQVDDKLTIELVGENKIIGNNQYKTSCILYGEHDYVFTGGGSLMVDNGNDSGNAIIVNSDPPPPSNDEIHRMTFDGVRIEASFSGFTHDTCMVRAHYFEVEAKSSSFKCTNCFIGIACDNLIMADSIISSDCDDSVECDIVLAFDKIVIDNPVFEGEFLFYDGPESNVPTEWSSETKKIGCIGPASVNNLEEKSNPVPVAIGFLIVVLALVAFGAYGFSKK